MRRGGSAAEIDALFDETFEKRLALNPEWANRLGDATVTDRWTDLSPERDVAELAILREALARMRRDFDRDTLPLEQRVSYRLFEYDTEMRLEGERWRLHEYPVTQMRGKHTAAVSFLVNVHRVDSVEDAEAYVKRLRGIGPLFEQLLANLFESQSAGIMPPKFVFNMSIDDCWNVITGRPFDKTDGAADSPLMADLRKKIDGLDGVDDAQRAALLESGIAALTETVGPAYQELIGFLEQQRALATTDDGVWKLPEGRDYYAYRLRRFTTTNLSADEIHQLGLKEVERIHGEMLKIMADVGFEGTLKEFFAYLRDDPRFYYPEGPEGRQQYLDRATEIIRTFERRLDEVFITQVDIPLDVRAVEPYREKSAGKAFYSRGAPDGSRPGIYYANLYRMRDMPIYQMEALAYHEGTPGHHMQGSISMTLTDLPQFRRHSHFTAYGEGWGLYSEYLPKEMGFYEDPYSDFGRLAMELWRACRLVVDTGLHDKEWSREKAIKYLTDHTPNPEGDCIKAIERYIVMPGQATAYTIGMLEILRLRKKAQDALGDDFDIREFHEVVITNGRRPARRAGAPRRQVGGVQDVVLRWTRSRLRPTRVSAVSMCGASGVRAASSPCATSATRS